MDLAISILDGDLHRTALAQQLWDKRMRSREGVAVIVNISYEKIPLKRQDGSSIERLNRDRIFIVLIGLFKVEEIKS